MKIAKSAHILRFFKIAVQRLFPLSNRKRLAIWIEAQSWLSFRHSLSMKLLGDWAEKDPNAFHRFFWSHHMGYAGFYEEHTEFGISNLAYTRRMLFADLKEFLDNHGAELKLPCIKSIFEVGCSAGYLLRFMETDLFPNAETFEGIDIDKVALEKGKLYLRNHQSKIRLFFADMADLDMFMGKRRYDLIICAGVLMYLNEHVATNIVKTMLNHSSGLVVIKGLAHPVVDNAKLGVSEPRMSDGAFFHNIDAMIEKARGTTVYHRWDGLKKVDGQAIYFVFGRPKAT